MSEHITDAMSLRRPRLLVRAARHGLDGFDRDRTLRRLLDRGEAPAPGRALAPLMAAEADLERVRVGGNAHYSALRHIEILSALMAEARIALAQERAAPSQVKASGISDLRRAT